MRSIPRTWLRSHNRSVCWNLSSKRHPDQPHALAFQIRLPSRIRARSTSTPADSSTARYPVDAGAAAQHRDRSIDHGDPPVTKPEQMPHRREPRRPTTVATLGSGNLASGSINTYGNVSVVEDVLIQRVQ
jgi:hypothetical protein